MKNISRILFALFLAPLCLVPCALEAAVTIKKAAPVATKASAGTDGAASLVPTAIGLVSGVISMNAKQNALSAECEPSAAEMTFVENTMKEWAKTGATTADALQKTLGREPCDGAVACYTTDVSTSNAPGLKPKYNNFQGPGNDNMVWYKFPRPGKGSYCKNGVEGCTGSDKIVKSDTYDLFNLIDFGPADYLPGETTMAAKLMSKVETCTDAKISAKKRALWGDFLVATASGVGQKTNTGSIMEQVGAISSQGGAGALGSIGTIASQFMAK